MQQSMTRLLILTSLMGCGTYRAPESIGAKMERYKARLENPNPVPMLKPWSTKKVAQKMQQKPRTPKQQTNTFSELSNKRLYFSALYEQYNEFRNYLGDDKAPALNHCPSHHNVFLKLSQGQTLTPKTLNISKRYHEINEQKVYPELSLTISSTQTTLQSALNQATTHQQKETLIIKAIEEHAKNTYQELLEVCDSGSSENYFTFANVASHIKNNRAAFHADKEQSLGSLLRTTVFYNRAVLSGLKRAQRRGRFPASANNRKEQLYGAVNNKLGTDWSEDFFSEL